MSADTLPADESPPFALLLVMVRSLLAEIEATEILVSGLALDAPHVSPPRLDELREFRERLIQNAAELSRPAPRLDRLYQLDMSDAWPQLRAEIIAYRRRVECERPRSADN